MYKNWHKICQEPNLLFRTLLIETEEPRILEGFERGFPQFFSETPVELTRIPLSLLRKYARELAKKNNPDNPGAVETDTEFDWHAVIDEVARDLMGNSCSQIPLLSFDTHENPPPPSILRQLKGQICQGGMRVKYRGGNYIVVHAWGLPEVGEVITETPEPEYLILAPAKFFDLEH